MKCRALNGLPLSVDGIEDRYPAASKALFGGTLAACCHRFPSKRGRRAGTGRADTHAIAGVQGLVGLARYARYDSRDASCAADTERIWSQLQDRL